MDKQTNHYCIIETIQNLIQLSKILFLTSKGFQFPIQLVIILFLGFCDTTLVNTPDCQFDELSSIEDAGFCGWRPISASSAYLWHTGNAVIVDSANYVLPDDSLGKKNNRFAYIQGKYGAGSEGSLECPIITHNLNRKKEFKLSYWKVEPLPTLDICIKDAIDNSLNCIDSIAGPGQQQWIQRTVELPASELPYRIVLRARNILSAEDIICIDNIQLVDANFTAPKLDNIDSVRKSSKFQQHDQDQFVMNYYRQMQDEENNNEKSNYDDNANNEEELIPLVEKLSSTLNEKSYNGRSRSSIIRPQIHQKSSSPLISSREHHLQQQASSYGAKTLYQQQNPMASNSFPQFPSFPDGMSHTVTAGNNQWRTAATIPIPIAENPEYCRAVKCSFLDDSCLWRLGSTWKKSAGSVVRETIGEDFLESAKFKAPLSSFLEFDLWMSDDSNLMVIEDMKEPIHEQVVLLNQFGMSNNGFHRFRVPLRPSFQPVTIKFRSTLPTGAFITISNIKMVDNNHDEIFCETIETETLNFAENELLKATSKLPSAPFVDFFSASTLPTFLPFLAQKSQPELSTSTPFGSSSTLLPLLSPTPAPIFNPFKPMFENGLMPIVPLKDDQQRLTALQKNQKNFSLPLMLAKNKGSLTNDMLQNFPQLLTSEADKETAKTIISSKQKEGIRSENFQDNQTKDRIIPEKRQESLEEETKSIDKLIGSVARQPVLEQQLRHLARNLGFEASSVPDRKTLDTLRRFLGSKLLSLSKDERNIENLVNFTALLPSLASYHQNQQINPPPSPFEAPEMPILPNDIKIGMRTDAETFELKGIENLSPIKPLNSDEMEKLRKELIPTKSVMATGKSAPKLSTILLNRLASLLNPSTVAADPQTPLTKENLDFIFQNALNGK